MVSCAPRLWKDDDMFDFMFAGACLMVAYVMEAYKRARKKKNADKKLSTKQAQVASWIPLIPAVVVAVLYTKVAGKHIDNFWWELVWNTLLFYMIQLAADMQWIKPVWEKFFPVATTDTSKESQCVEQSQDVVFKD